MPKRHQRQSTLIPNGHEQAAGLKFPACEGIANLFNFTSQQLHFAAIRLIAFSIAKIVLSTLSVLTPMPRYVLP